MDLDNMILDMILVELKMVQSVIKDYYEINNINDKIIEGNDGKAKAFVCAEFGYYILETLNMLGIEEELCTYDDNEDEEYMFTYNGVEYYIDESVDFGDIKFMLIKNTDNKYIPVDNNKVDINSDTDNGVALAPIKMD